MRGYVDKSQKSVRVVVEGGGKACGGRTLKEMAAVGLEGIGARMQRAPAPTI